MYFSLATYSAALVSLASLSVAVDIPVVVGGPNLLKFDPESVTAAVGDRIIFQFREKNHTATQSTLANPCTKVEGGFDSGYVPVAPGATGDVAVFTVPDANPVWVYCAQGAGAHCKAGMVFAINPGDKFAEFKAAATGQAPPTGTAPGATPTDYKVIVGGPGKLIFDPANIKANPGDTVTFEFRQKAHSVTQSTFAAPCAPLQPGFDSGIMPVAEGVTAFPTYQIKVNDTSPVWAYCKQGTHCQAGMVFAINAPATGNTFDNFKAKAADPSGTGTTTTGTPAPSSGANRVVAGSGFALAVAAFIGLAL